MCNYIYIIYIYIYNTFKLRMMKIVFSQSFNSV